MDIESKKKNLRNKVEELEYGVANMSRQQREDAIVDIGFSASKVDIEAMYLPNQKEIKRGTDRLIRRAEQMVEANNDRDYLKRAIKDQPATCVRKSNNKRIM